MKLLAEILISIFIHPLAFVLAVVNIVQREDLGQVERIVWIVVSFFWGIGPILYVLVGKGQLW